VLLSFSPQAFGIRLLASLTDMVPSSRMVPREIPLAIWSGSDIECPYFPAEFPLCRDLVQPSKTLQPQPIYQF